MRNMRKIRLTRIIVSGVTANGQHITGRHVGFVDTWVNTTRMSVLMQCQLGRVSSGSLTLARFPSHTIISIELLRVLAEVPSVRLVALASDSLWTRCSRTTNPQ